MVRRLSVEGNCTSKAEKSDTKRGSTLLRAPPGGPMAATTWMSFMLRHDSSLRSYSPLRSTNSFSSAMGCCVP